jgi:hypothetical protein
MPRRPVDHVSRAALTVVALSVAALAACLVDPDHRCGEHQALDGDRCVCAEGYGLVDDACVKCGKHEVGSLSGCACEDGYVRASPDGACEEMQALGAACQDDDDCADDAYARCAMDGDEGYCTSDCDSSDDCETSVDYACNERVSEPFCERPPSGLGTACDGADECADFEASYCEVLSEHLCLVNGCKEDAERCHGDWVCCDLPILATSLCVPPAQLEDGNCPVAGTIVPRPE